MYIKLTNSTIHIQKLGKKDKEHEGSKGEREGKRIWERKWEKERKRERKPAGSQPASQQAFEQFRRSHSLPHCRLLCCSVSMNYTQKRSGSLSVCMGLSWWEHLSRSSVILMFKDESYSSNMQANYFNSCSTEIQ